MRDLDKTVFARANEKIDVASLPQLVRFRKSRECHDFAVARSGHLYRGEDIRRTAGTRNRDQQVAWTGVKLKLLGKNILVTEIIAKASQRGWIVEGERSQAAVLGKIDGEMTGDASAAAVADKDYLIAGVVRRVSGIAHPFATLSERQILGLTISDLGTAQEVRERRKVPIQLLLHTIPLLLAETI
jgi:hypothetical protein